MVSLDELSFSKSFVLKKVAAAVATAPPDKVQKMFFRVSFYSMALDRIAAPVTYSEQTEVKLDQTVDLESIETAWSKAQLPLMRTAFNSLNLFKDSRLIMMIWAAGNGLSTETLVGQVNINMSDMQQESGRDMLF